MQAIVSSEGTAGSYALLLLLKQPADNGRVVRHFVCCECAGLLEAVQGWHYLHTCGDGDYAEGLHVRRPASRAMAADLPALLV